MKAFAGVERGEFDMVKVTVLDMDILLSHAQKDIVGVPIYFDEQERVWPKPGLGVEVVFLQP
jgi:hypothetical protein